MASCWFDLAFFRELKILEELEKVFLVF